MTYRPSPEVSKILVWAREQIDNVPYEVTSRWAFYQVVQVRGVPKRLYRLFLKWTSRARKAFWNGWNPTTFSDDTREIDVRDGGYETPQEWINHFREEECYLAVASRQENIVLVLFEAAAMKSQFDYYLGPLRVSTAPFRGDASISHKWKIAKRLEALHKAHPEKSITVLYFGDLDPKGLEIPRNAMRDIWSWIRADDLGTTLNPKERKGREEWSGPGGKFRWIRVGLNQDQADALNIAENPEKPGTYQWEALNDEQAGQLILDAVREFWSEDVVREVDEEEQAATKRWQGAIARWLRRWRAE